MSPRELINESKTVYSFRPQPVVESRWKEMQFVPEILFNNVNYVLGPPESTHDAAMEIAKKKCEEMIADMLATGLKHVAGLKKAKA